MEVRVHRNNIERALKQLKRKLVKSGMFQEIRQRSFYEKPSEKKKRKQKEAREKRNKFRRSFGHS